MKSKTFPDHHIDLKAFIQSEDILMIPNIIVVNALLQQHHQGQKHYSMEMQSHNTPPNQPMLTRKSSQHYKYFQTTTKCITTMQQYPIIFEFSFIEFIQILFNTKLYFLSWQQSPAICSFWKFQQIKLQANLDLIIGEQVYSCALCK